MRDLLHSLGLWLARKTRTPYECYWRDRALKAERQRLDDAALHAVERWCGY